MLCGCNRSTFGLKSVKDKLSDVILPEQNITETLKEPDTKEDSPPTEETETQKPVDDKKTETIKKPDSESAAVSTPNTTDSIEQIQTEPKSEQDTPPDTASEEPEQPQTPNAGASDAEAVADRVIYYINLHRTETGAKALSKLPGLTVFSEYRSRQIINNFSHDITDRRAAAAALKYGEYIDPKDYNVDAEPYYEVDAREAISKHGQTGTVDQIAKEIADMFKNSASHWSYLGDNDYGFTGVGVTYQSGMWYCAVSVSITDIG